jgi:hypothetical protein
MDQRIFCLPFLTKLSGIALEELVRKVFKLAWRQALNLSFLAKQNRTPTTVHCPQSTSFVPRKKRIRKTNPPFRPYPLCPIHYPFSIRSSKKVNSKNEPLSIVHHPLHSFLEKNEFEKRIHLSALIPYALSLFHSFLEKNEFEKRIHHPPPTCNLLHVTCNLKSAGLKEPGRPVRCIT